MKIYLLTKVREKESTIKLFINCPAMGCQIRRFLKQVITFSLRDDLLNFVHIFNYFIYQFNSFQYLFSTVHIFLFA